MNEGLSSIINIAAMLQYPKIPTTIVNDVLTDDEIQHVWSLRGTMDPGGKNTKTNESSHVISRYLSTEINDPTILAVLEKLLLPGESMACLAYWESRRPFGLHTDNSSTTKAVLGRVITLPMPCDPHRTGSPTVIFKSMWNGVPTKFVRGLDGINKNYQMEVEDYSVIPDWQDRPFDTEMHAKYLSHLPLDNLRGFEVETILPWVPGTAMMFDNRMIHCSSNYASFGVTTKRNLAIITRIDL